MSFFQRIEQRQSQNNSMLCVGLDPHPDKMPSHLKGDMATFNKAIIDATAEYACCFKPQIAYYAAYGAEAALVETISYIQKAHPDIPVILDAKRNDIGATAEMYAREAFVRYGADAVTVNPYMGGDTIEPFSKDKDKGVFLLCRTSNPGAEETQNITSSEGTPYYQYIAEKALETWNENKNIGIVVGATAIDELRTLRGRFPQAWFLVPGVGAQGGDLQAVVSYGSRAEGGGLIINSSRSILYASSGEDFAEKAADQAKDFCSQVEQAQA